MRWYYSLHVDYPVLYPHGLTIGEPCVNSKYLKYRSDTATPILDLIKFLDNKSMARRDRTSPKYSLLEIWVCNDNCLALPH